MNNYIKKQTSIDLNKDLNEELSIKEALNELKEQQTPEYLFYKGYIDGCEDFENNNSLLFESFIDKNEHYTAGYNEAQEYAKKLPDIYKRREYYRKKLAEVKLKYNLK